VLDNEREFALKLVHHFVVASQIELVTACDDLELWKETLDMFEVCIVDSVDFGRIKAFNADLTLT
jgi:hypothetical protein